MEELAFTNVGENLKVISEQIIIWRIKYLFVIIEDWDIWMWFGTAISQDNHMNQLNLPPQSTFFERSANRR